jgi:hypothetical protein
MERYEKIECRHCNKKSYFAFIILLHCMREHHKKITKKDIKFAIKYGIIGTTAKNILFIIKFIILLICLPFHLIYENLC